MGLENSEPRKQEPLSEADALKHANLLRANLDMNPKTGKVPDIKSLDGSMVLTERNVNAGDYQAATEIVDDLMKRAKGQTASESVQKSLQRLGIQTSSFLQKLGMVFMDRYDDIVNDNGIFPVSRGEVFEAQKKERLAAIEDARRELKDLEKKARQF